MDGWRVQIAQMEQSLHRAKMAFNERFLALRDVKRAVVRQLQTKCAQLAAANAELGIDEQIQTPRMTADEEPERRDEVSEDEIKAFIAERDAADAAAAKVAAGDESGGGFGDFGGASKVAQDRAAAAAPALDASVGTASNHLL